MINRTSIAPPLLKTRGLSLVWIVIGLISAMGLASGCAGGGTGGTDGGGILNATVLGKVLDQDGAPLSGATVTVLDDGKAALTSESGEFVLSNVSAPQDGLTFEISQDGNSI